ncbi:HEAT repeat domain-containing protein [Gordonia otitidis]|uniref:MerR family transcriptional regulator n=1 Tax=Gordonia otitidis (strain DSM 44809 / CCUG 52243 / JCM 12355 / NBRC 100426 / IFM 10032) TaxID=1108044 RepID=H5TII6_GORO1|nr:HEAT repeat domain-containing protein [Gordonia otitidis]UEA60526.1 MerR family DNA-binding transcriptional regulator [Gordonia otitidis]GAB33294.1 putative MerR family transcriptional regulator [Gordonia otitidis NBRC 100426]
MLIGEVSRRSGVSVRMLRHYDRLGLVSPTTRTSGGYRDYSPDDIARLFRVIGLRALGVPLASMAALLDTPESTEPTAMVDDLIDQTRRRLSRDTELLTLLTRIADSAPADWLDVLQTVRILQDLDSGSATRRQRAALAASDGRLSAEALAKAVLAETDTNVAGALLWALADAADPAAETALAAGLDSPQPEVRRRSVEAIAKLHTDSAVEVLRSALTDADVAVRNTAALALGARGHLEVLEPLVTMIVEGAHDVDAADILSELAQTASVSDSIATRLGRLLENGNLESSARSRVAQALVELPGPVAASILVAHVDDVEPAVAALATLRQRRSEADAGTP